MTKKQDNLLIKKEDFNDISGLVLAIAQDIARTLTDYKNKDKAVSEMLALAGQLWKDNKDTARDVYRKVFFEMRLYSKLNLKAYYAEYGVGFEYNVKKDRLWVFGNPSEIEDTYLTWKQKQKLEKEVITQDTKTRQTFDRVIKTLDKEHIQDLIKRLNEQLHKTI